MALQDDPCIQNWLERLGSCSKTAYRTFEKFHEEVLSGHSVFGGMSPTQLVDWQSNTRGREAYSMKNLAQRWVNKKSLRISSKKTYLTHLSSFFLHNHTPWPPDPSFHFSSDTAPVEGKLTVEAFKRILLNCDKRYRTVFLMQAQMLAGPGDMVYVSNHYRDEILQHITKNNGVFKVTLPGRKRNRNTVNYYTLLSTKSDWADAMRGYLKSLPNLPDTVLFRNDHGRPLTRLNIEWYFHKRAIEAGIIKQATPKCQKCGAETVWTRDFHNGKSKVAYKCKECHQLNWACEMNLDLRSNRYGVNPHEIRDLMRSRWRASGAKVVVAEFMMQHGETVDPNQYDKLKYTPMDAIVEYRKALPWLNVLSHDPNKVDRSEVDSKLEASEAKVDVLSREVARLQGDVKQFSWLADPKKSDFMKKSVEHYIEFLKKKEKGN